MTTNPAFNLTPSLGPIRADEATVSLESVKHPNSLEDFQGQWNLKNLDRGFADIPQKKEQLKELYLRN